MAVILGQRLLLFAILACLAHTFIDFADDFGDERNLAGHFVEQQSHRLAAAASLASGSIILSDAALAPYRNGGTGKAYGYRLTDAITHASVASNPELLVQDWHPAAGDRREFWAADEQGAGRFRAFGRTSQIIDGRAFWVDVATDGDPAWLRYWSVVPDLIRHLSLHILTVALVPIVALVSISLLIRSMSRAFRRIEQRDAQGGANPGREDGTLTEPAGVCEEFDRLTERFASALKSGDEISGQIAHQLRTPLTVMLLELNTVTDPAARRLELDVEKMRSSIDYLLSFARLKHIEPRAFEAVDLPKLAHEVVESLAPLVRARGAAIRIETAGGPSIRGDRASLREAVVNLIENALRHCPKPVQIKVQCGPGSRIAIEDDGPGIPEENQSGLFVPFGIRKIGDERSGLGLAFVKDVMRCHRGDVAISRSLLGGACLELSFEGTNLPELTRSATALQNPVARFFDWRSKSIGAKRGVQA